MEETGLIRKVIRYFNLESDLENDDRVHEVIVKDTEFKGTNLWILMFAIVVASVGLNMNSPAVIIGAMLISPLMGPINGMGYSIATYNLDLFRRALKNFSFAVFVSLAASTAYFALSPISTAHSELLARTSPTIYDVLIALFGGLAGIIALSTKQKGNVIPGVAIATALMPPLCTAGYGLATGQFDFFFGAIYLFTINTVFIALSSVVVSQLLKFPIRTDIAEKQKRKINQWISLVIVLIIVPSIYFGYDLVQKEKFNENAKRYVANISIYEGNYLLHNEVNPAKKQIRLVYGGTNLRKDQKEKIRESAANFELNGAVILVEQGLSFGQTSEQDKLKAEMNAITTILGTKDRELERYINIRKTGESLLNELRAFYPNSIESCSYAETDLYRVKHTEAINIVIIGTSKKLPLEDEAKIKQWMAKRLHKNKVHVLFEMEKVQATEVQDTL
jgi:uncharacterized hydrophobic protein (TIGR00271 family)